MVNFLHNITALAGAATLVKIFDFKNQVVNLSGDNDADGTAIVSFPETPGASNEDWFIIPQADAATFTLQSVGQPSFFVSYAGAATQAFSHSQAVASSSLPTVFKMEIVGNGPVVNLIDSATNSVLTSWVNADPATWSDPTTPITMENFQMPKSFMQSFTITLS
ncbi:hypothetical protein MVEN_01795900 [Mycena venus]|uniref:Ricin B lectin domain-containing protein n=1 Tax=Mycena venus TaxID=2733690 RepID=A0A8H7CN38_9AGAR|nr:hypothetical protein MVEN_01795900 [Mycena venus]